MATGHPVDSLGLALPRCDWPEDRAAPGSLELVRRFCNTTNLESGGERLRSPGDLDEWLAEQGHARVGTDLAGLETTIELREAVRRHAVAHRDRGQRRSDDIAQLVSGVPMKVVARDGLAVEPAADGLARLLGEIAIAVVESELVGTWPRLKACSNCSWVFYDHSKNRSGRWCSMAACGGRAKVRAHRQRARERS